LNKLLVLLNSIHITQTQHHYTPSRKKKQNGGGGGGGDSKMDLQYLKQH